MNPSEGCDFTPDSAMSQREKPPFTLVFKYSSVSIILDPFNHPLGALLQPPAWRATQEKDG